MWRGGIMWRGHSCPRSAINSSVSTQSLVILSAPFRAKDLCICWRAARVSVAKEVGLRPVISVTTLSTFVACQAIFFPPLSTHSPARKSTGAHADPYWPRIVKIEIHVLNSRPCRSSFGHLSHPAKPLFRNILQISSLLARFYAEWPGSKDSNRRRIMDLARTIRKKHAALSMCGGRL